MPIAEPHRSVAGDARIEAACFVDQIPAAIGRAHSYRVISTVNRGLSSARNTGALSMVAGV